MDYALKEIKNKLDVIYPLKAETWSKVSQLSIYKEFIKGQELTRTEEFFDYEVFLLKGVVRCYLRTPEGREYTTSFYADGDFLAPAYSRVYQGKSLLNIQAIEDSAILLFPEQEFTKLRYKHKDLLQLGAKVVEKELFHKSQKEVILATKNLKDLYNFFQAHFQGLENRISQRNIASYLGTDPVSLSRIRGIIKQLDRQ